MPTVQIMSVIGSAVPAPLRELGLLACWYLVSDGETIVIGGVFSNTQTKAVDKVPLLGDIPFVGRLFRRDTVQDTKNELLVFITPRIMNNQAIAVSNR